MSEISGRIYEFGDFQLDTAESVLRRAGEIVPLTPKAVQALTLLVESGGHVLSRTSLIEALWPDAFVEEANLTVTISMLRKALGEHENKLKFIETVPKRGYRFVATVKAMSVSTTPSRAEVGDALHHVPAPVAASGRKWRLPLLVGACGLVAVTLAYILYSVIARPPSPSTDKRGAMRLTQLTDDGNVRDVTISPDGSYLAFVLIEKGREGLWVRNLVTNEKWQVLPPQEGICWGPRFTLDGQNLYYVTTAPDSTISVLYRIGLRGGSPQRIVVNIDSPVTLSPDGVQLAFVRSFPGRHYDALVVANNDGTAERELAISRHPNRFSFSGASWSPDGKLIALGAKLDNQAGYKVIGMPSAGGEPRELVEQEWLSIHGVAWAEDGRSLFLAGGMKGAPALQIWRLSYPGGSLERVTNDTNNYDGVHLVKGASTLVTMQTGHLVNLWSADLSANTSRKITAGRKEGEGGVVTTSAGEIIYTVEENGRMNLWRMSADGANRRQLTQLEANLPTAPSDGRFLVYSSPRNGIYHLYRLDLQNGEEKQLTDGGGELYPSCSPDGRWIVYTALAGERNTLWKVSTDGGIPTQLTRSSIIIKPVVSPDGHWIACTYRQSEADKWKIAILPFDGTQPVKVFAFPMPFRQVLQWTPDSAALCFLEEEKGVSNVWRQPLAGAGPQPLTRFTEDLIYSYCLSSEHYLILARGKDTRDIVLIEHVE